ncbi:hypothetical protein CDD80_78 [Ophiocordyceps camponoti-rufipedis]|uniref:NADH dehydrogenase [ubiquinone] 1 alpha subcomplex subunit 1 n=1 Tax=Ophiocordyceps camponoti-rufipedis TaxID=2004952 RepID=A0A2C5ZLR4_9HYPO|nr:hypothetical protein CDD80_78 [Ophiocordyceps camponoti-rufipedis]
MRLEIEASGIHSGVLTAAGLNLEAPSHLKTASTAHPISTIAHLLQDDTYVRDGQRGTNNAAMPVPFEALLPYAIMIGMFGVTGLGLGYVKSYQNEGKNPRWSIDTWDPKYSLAPHNLYRTDQLDSSDVA